MRKNLPWLALILFALAFSVRLLPGARTIDDSYITYRYARNILAGDGFVYNRGEAVMGTTTPLYTIVLVSIGFFLGGENAPFPEISWILNALFDGISVLLLWQLGKKLSLRWAGLAAGLIWAVAPFSVTFAIGGLETSMYVLLLLGCAYAYLDQKTGTAALLAGLAVLTRPDAVLLLAPIGLDHLVRILRKETRFRWKDLILLGLLPAAWLIFSATTFGSVVPNSVQAKIGAYQLQPDDGLIRFIQHFATPFMHQHWFGDLVAIASGLILYPFFYLIGARFIFRRNPRSLPILIFPWLYLVVFALANPMIFRWYLTPPLPFYIFGILCGLEALGNSFVELFQDRVAPQFRSILFFFFIILLPTASMVSAWDFKPDHGLTRPAPEMAFYELEIKYVQAARIVGEALPIGGTLAAGDVGVLGYETNAVILDTVGLNSPVSLGYYPLDKDCYVTNYAISGDLIVDQLPDMIVFLEVYGRNTLLKDERFLNQYQLVSKIDTNIYGSDGMLIFQKIDVR